MLIEAVLTICLTTALNDWKGDPDTGPTCIHMPIGEDTRFESMGQCEFWLRQGLNTVSVREHRDVIYGLIPWDRVDDDARPIIKGECRKVIFEEPYQCRDCDT